MPKKYITPAELFREDECNRDKIADGILRPAAVSEIGSGATAWVEPGICDACGKHSKVLVSDSSGDLEYTPVKICEFCLGKMFDRSQTRKT
jgi:hypothetical protein